MSNSVPTVSAVAQEIRETDFDPARVLAQVMAMYAVSRDSADLVDELGSLLAPVAAEALLPALDVDNQDSVEFYSAVAGK